MTPADLPGPRSAAELERLRAVLYPRIGEDLAPFVLDRKSGSPLVDLDGNEYVDCASASASVPLGAAREDLIEPMVDALRRYGNEDGHGIASDLADPGRLRPQRHRGDRDRGEGDAPRHRPPDHPRLPRRLPRRDDDHRRA